MLVAFLVELRMVVKGDNKEEDYVDVSEVWTSIMAKYNIQFRMWQSNLYIHAFQH